MPQQKNSSKKKKTIIIGSILFVIVSAICFYYLVISSTKTTSKDVSSIHQYTTTFTPILTPFTTTFTPLTTTINPYTYTYMNPVFMDACYSMRLVVPTYTGPVVCFELENGTLQDFYTDATQSYMTTGFNNTGTSISTLIGLDVGIGKARIWYDQSGHGNNAICDVDVQCPIAYKEGLPTFTRHVLGFPYTTGNEYFLKTQKAISPYSILTQFYWNKSATGSYGTILSSTEKSGYGVRFYNNNIYSEQNEYDWFYRGAGDKYSLLNGSATNQILTQKVWTTLCLSVQTPEDIKMDIIGKDTASPTRSISCFLSEMIFYNKPLSSQEIQEYYDRKFSP